MKKAFLKYPSALVMAALFSLGGGAQQSAIASMDLDKQYQLETVGVLKSWDNVDGLFSEYVTSAYKNYFSKQSRFVLGDFLRVDGTLGKSKLSYRKIIEDREILGQLARSTRSDSILRTRIVKEQSHYLFTVDWLYSPKMELMATHTFTLSELPEGGTLDEVTLGNLLKENLPTLFSQVPFLGNVTGRDGESVTINLGATADIRVGDMISIGTVDEVKKHPLTQKVVGWKMTPTGRVKVEQVDDSLAFCKILEEIPGKKLNRYQKVLGIEHDMTMSDIVKTPAEGASTETQAVEEDPKLGWVALGLDGGGYSRDFSVPSGSISSSAASRSGGGVPIGARAGGELWFTKHWFANAYFGYSFWTFSQKDIQSGTQTAASQNGGVASSNMLLKGNAGYSFLINGELTGPRVWVKAGYKSNSFSFPNTLSPEFTGSISIGSIFVGAGGEMPLRGSYGLVADFGFRVITMVDQTWLSDTVSGASDVEFFVGGFYKLTPSLKVRAGVQFDAASVDFTGGSTLNQKTITFAPSLLYYF